LRVLKLAVYRSAFEIPMTTELQSKRDSEQHWMQRLAKRTADKILSELANDCPHLMAIVIEIDDDKVVDPETRTMRWPNDLSYAFIRSKQTDLYGITATVGMPVETHMVKHYEPCSNVLHLIGWSPDEH
jgi:hypothetical protein